MFKLNISLPNLIQSFITTYPVQYLIKNTKKHYATSPLKVYVSVISGSALMYGTCATIIFKDSSKPDTRLGSKERFFLKFASVEYNGQVCMTPQDFLDSIVEEEPRYNRRKVLGKRDMEEVIKSAKGLKPETPRIFGTLGDKGIISFTEFLFLLSVLTKPESGFRIAFDMFDVDGNQNIDKKEFLVMKKIFSQAWKGKKVDGSDLELQLNQKIDTTLLIYFFGLAGTKTLNFDVFRTFMVNLQTEILEKQFYEFSKGSPTISEYDFAVILLRYTRLDENHKAKYLRRLASRIDGGQGITFDEFCVFGKLLKSLDDFSMALKMYTLANRPITKREFLRAAKICVGTELSVCVVDTVFALFDDDYDELLSYEEFLAVMKERGQWSFKSHEGNSSNKWKAFRKCVSKEIK